MPFAPVPPESKKTINKAGQTLARGETEPAEFAAAWELANRWRACHAYPINTFQATLRSRLRHYAGEPIVAQRLKRMPTIIDKLRRYPTMQLTTMQDIGGLRVVLRALPQVRRLAAQYKLPARLPHDLIAEYDYIASPRSEDGYRSNHLVFKYRNPAYPSYDGLRVELQIRTRLQHTWATAVETMGTLLGQALKSRKGDQNWLDFFAIASSAFAHDEKSPLVPRFAHLSRDETCRELAKSEANLGALDMMNALSVAANAITTSKGASRTWSYHLIILNSLERKVSITAYDRNSFERAEADYYKAEKEAAEGSKLEPVLVSAGPLATLRRAYPNFFLDMREFVRLIDGVVAEGRK